MGQAKTRLRLCTAAGAVLIGIPATVAAAASGEASGRGDLSASTPATTTTPAAGTSATPAGTVTVNPPCAVNTAQAAAKITVTGAGWSPGDTIQLTDTRGVVTSTVTVTSAGGFAAVVPAPVVPTRDVDISDTIQAIDEGNQGSEGSAPAGGPTAYSAPFLTTDYAVKVSGSDPLEKLVFNLSGFAAQRTVYGHYLTASGKLLATASFGKPTGACGLRRVEAYEYPPGGRARKGSYMIQFDNDARYSAHTTPDFRYVYVISRL